MSVNELANTQETVGLNLRRRNEEPAFGAPRQLADIQRQTLNVVIQIHGEMRYQFFFTCMMSGYAFLFVPLLMSIKSDSVVSSGASKLSLIAGISGMAYAAMKYWNDLNRRLRPAIKAAYDVAVICEWGGAKDEAFTFLSIVTSAAVSALFASTAVESTGATVAFMAGYATLAYCVLKSESDFGNALRIPEPVLLPV